MVKLRLTLDGEIILSFWVNKTKEDPGFCLGIDEEGSKIHLTAFLQKEKLRYHIKHIGGETNDYSLGRQTSTKVVTARSMELLKKRVVPYHGNQKCWIPTREYAEAIRDFIKKYGPHTDPSGNITIPLEYVLAELGSDFNNNRLWRKVKIRDLFQDQLVSKESKPAFINTPKGIRWITPITENLIISFPLSKVYEIPDYISDIFGLTEYFDYLINTDEGKNQIERIKRRIKNVLREKTYS